MKYRPPLGLSQPLDRSCAVEINLAYSCSLQAVPFVFLSRRAARRSAPFDAAAAQSSHDDRQRLSPSLEAGSEKEATGIGAWRPESDRGAGLPGRAHLSEPAGGALSSRAAALVAGKDGQRLPFHLDN